MTDPTNARLRDFDIPVIMPRIDLLELPPFDDHVTTGDCGHSGPPAGGPGGPGKPGKPGGPGHK